MPNIFFDLDGTIINSQHRLYNLFCELCIENRFSYEKYWEIKRSRISQKEFLQTYYKYSDEACIDFKNKWLEKVEEKERVLQDCLVEGIEAVLQRLSINNDLYIVTNRQNEKLVKLQLFQLKIDKYFKNILVTSQKFTKVELIEKNCSISFQDVFIGDTGEDIQTAKTLKITAVAVTWGILSKEILMEYSPDYIFERIDNFDNCSFLY